MKLKLFGALIGALMLAAAAPAGATTVSGSPIVNDLGTIIPKHPTVNPFSVTDLTNGVQGINGDDFSNGHRYFDYIFKFTLNVDATVSIAADQSTAAHPAGTNVLDFHAALFDSNPVSTGLDIGAPDKIILLHDTTHRLFEDETNGGTVNLSSLTLDPGVYYLRLFGSIAGNSANSVITGLNGTITATPIPAGLPLLMTSLGVMGFMVWRRKTAAPTAAL